MKNEKAKCRCGNTQNTEGYCDGSHANKLKNSPKNK
jgi:CDGSH-type Zn-finger protein